MGASETSTSMKVVEQEPKFPHLQRHSSIKLSIEDKILAIINPRNRSYTQSYIDIATTLITVDVFVGAICLGALANISPSFPNFNFVIRLLAICSLIFTVSLFFAFGILYIMRNEPRDRPPSKRRQIMGSLQYLVAFLLSLAGFAVGNVILISIGQPIVGYCGIGMLVTVPFWVVGIAQLDRTGWLDDPVEMEMGIDADGQPVEMVRPQRPLAENPIYYTAANKHILP